MQCEGLNLVFNENMFFGQKTNNKMKYTSLVIFWIEGILDTLHLCKINKKATAKNAHNPKASKAHCTLKK